jgi:hypothetical protein
VCCDLSPIILKQVAYWIEEVTSNGFLFVGSQKTNLPKERASQFRSLQGNAKTSLPKQFTSLNEFSGPISRQLGLFDSRK